MSHLLRWFGNNPSLAARSTALLRNRGCLVTTTPFSEGHLKPLYRVMQTQQISTTPPLMGQPQDKPGKEPPKKDDMKYVIKFKDVDLKAIFKQFYSIYGPLFVVCHIGISLLSLGFFCSLTYFAIDLNQFIPNFFYLNLGSSMADMTGTGGKFLLAYAVHKAILPFRLGGAIWLTRYLSKYFKKAKSK